MMKDATTCDWVFWSQAVRRDGVAPYSFQCGDRQHDAAHSPSGGNSELGGTEVGNAYAGDVQMNATRHFKPEDERKKGGLHAAFAL